MGWRRRATLILALGALTVATAACGNGGGDEGKIDTTLKDFAISLSPATAGAGNVTFDITNDGPSEHEFVVFGTDLGAKELPTEKVEGAEEVVEDAPELEAMGEQEDIASGTTTTLKLDLPAGHYVVICNLPTHYGLGMSSELTVS
jgi:uncharacterized cupredoxin-like copper-binding protein